MKTSPLWTLHHLHRQQIKKWNSNPRQITDLQKAQLEKSLETFGLCQPLVLNADFTLLGGHQRYEITQADPIPCYIPNRLLDEKEAQELALRLNQNGGSWDFDILANEFDLGDLLDVGFDPSELGLETKKEKVSKPKITISFDSTEILHSVYEQILPFIENQEGISFKVKN